LDDGDGLLGRPLEDMEAGVAVESLGLMVCVGPSLVADGGRGLFLCVCDDGVEEVTLPSGTPVCGYSKGRFTDVYASDKSVAYAFTAPTDGVLFEGKLMSLIDAVEQAAARLPPLAAGGDSSSTSSSSISHDVTYLVRGHVVAWDVAADAYTVTPAPGFVDRIFVPYEADDAPDNPMGIGRFGMYANDIAYFDDVPEDVYVANADDINILQLVWRMAWAADHNELVPTWPVVVTAKDTVLTNREPGEVGLKYGWRYWSNTRSQAPGNE
jgi:hypothetical protein